MKFIPLLFALGLISVNSQITTATGAQVFVSPETLVYSTGDFTVKTGTTKVTNKGNIKIGKPGDVTTGTYIAESGVAENIFVLSYDDVDQYGQLIIESGKAASGKISKQYKPDLAGGRNVYIGVPFASGNYTHDNLISDLSETPGSTFNALPSNCWAFNCGASKYNAFPVMYWNDRRQVFDPNSSGVLEPGVFYLLRKNLNYFPAGQVDFAKVVSFSGTPFVASNSNPELSFGRRLVNGPQNIGNGRRNEYSVRYYTYLADPFNEVTSYTISTTDEELNNQYYADNTLQIMNPYTSNLDLKVLTNNYENLKGISSVRSISQHGTVSSRYSGLMLIAKVIAGDLDIAGDDIRYIPPMTNFILKGNDGVNNLKVKFAPGTSTLASSQTFTKGGYYNIAGRNDPAAAVAPVAASRMSISSKSTNNAIERYQLNLQLWDNDVNTFVGNTYVYSSASQITGVYNSDSESQNVDINSTITGVYTIPEAPTGGVDPNHPDVKLYINTINTDAAKVAIPVGINIAAGENVSDYIFKANLKENGEYLTDNKLISFANPSAKFYLHDKKTSSVTEINENFSFPVKIEDDSYTTKNADGSKTVTRYEIFWKETGTMGNEDIQTLDGLTSVYKSGNEYKVRFDKNWNKADINIFNVLGQLISSEKNIDTQDDYLLPINGNSSTMYIIKIANDKGEIVTKKIVK